MKTPTSDYGKLQRGFWILVLLALLVALTWSLRPRKKLTQIPRLFPVPEFTLTNQDGRRVTLSNFVGKIWVADIIFTRCAGPCPVMTRKLSEWQAALPPDGSVHLVTLTTDPVFDTPTVLKEYARKFNAQTDRWHFLTGSQKEIAQLAVDGLKLTAVEKNPGERSDPYDLFIHSTLFVLVDRHGWVRAVFESDQPETQTNLLRTIALLQRER